MYSFIKIERGEKQNFFCFKYFPTEKSSLINFGEF